MTDLYEVLGLNKNAEKEDIKKAHRELARKYHPDKNHGDEEAAKMFKKVQEAYDILMDDEKRAEYDIHGRVGADAENIYTAALQQVTIVFERHVLTAVRSGGEIKHIDLIKKMTNTLEEMDRSDVEDEHKLKEALGKMEDGAKRMRRKDAKTTGHDFMSDLFRKQIEDLQRGIAGNALKQKVNRKSLDVVAQYAFDCEKVNSWEDVSFGGFEYRGGGNPFATRRAKPPSAPAPQIDEKTTEAPKKLGK